MKKSDTIFTVWTGNYYKVIELNRRYYVRTHPMGACIGARMIRGATLGPPPSLKGENLDKEAALLLAHEWDDYTTRANIKDAKEKRRENKLREVRAKYDAAFKN